MSADQKTARSLGPRSEKIVTPLSIARRTAEENGEWLAATMGCVTAIGWGLGPGACPLFPP